MDLDVLGQERLVKFTGLFLHRFEHILCLLATAHQDHTFYCVVIISCVGLVSECSQPWRMSNGDVSDIPDADRRSLVAGNNDVADIIAVLHQAEAADVVKLPALRVKTSASVGIIHRYRLNHLRHSQVIAKESCWIQ